MSNEHISGGTAILHLTVPSKAHADMLVEILEKTHSPGSSAQILADLYAGAKAIQRAFASGP